ncbi:hypothetical protein MMC11_008057 [Xylographa trunciseda]|nr:hypothetical protein [Xylographa trunciseda]
MEPLSPPTTFEEVERVLLPALVQRLYLPGPPRQIAQIQQALQDIQKSAEGWALADALLRSDDANVRFFGALTFTIKINTDWLSLGDESSKLLETLLSWLIRLVSLNERPLVVRKLGSALVAQFFQPAAQWTRCVRHVICCFYTSSVMLEKDVDSLPPSSSMVQNLNASQVIATLWFATTLVEEAGKLGAETSQTHIYHEKTAASIDDIVLILNCVLDNGINSDTTLTNEGIKCCQSWIMYAQRAWFKKDQYLSRFKCLNPYIIECFKFTETTDASREFLIDVLSNFATYLVPSDYDHLAHILNSPLCNSFMGSLRNGDFGSDAVAFASLLLAFGDASVQDLAQKTESSDYVSILSLLEGLLMCKGYAVVDDEICSQALEFWITFAEYLTDSLFAAGNDRPNWMDYAFQTLMRVIEASWRKSLLPPPDITSSWDHDTRIGFKAFRADVEDLLQSSYTLLGLSLYERFVHLALHALHNGAWYHLEATLFCLNALADSVAEEGIADQSLLQIFGSNFFSQMTGDGALIPVKCQQTAVTMINRHTAFFERHVEYLPQVLNFLFSRLQTSDLANHSSKAILALCYSCRKMLTLELDAFLHQYDKLLSHNLIDINTKERVLGAIAAIVQAVNPDEKMLAPLDRLLLFVQADVQSCLSLLTSGHVEEAQQVGLAALKCLVSIGKAMQVPDEGPIDLESSKSTPTVWKKDSGIAIQSRIVQCYEVIFSSLQSEGEIVETTCQILRAGYTETTLGPFVLSPMKTADLVTNSTLSTARLGYILDTAGLMLGQTMTEYSDHIKPAALKCFAHSLQLVAAVGYDPTQDPEVASSCIELAGKMITRHIDVFFDSQLQSMLPNFFAFSMQCLISPEILPKRSSASFWASFVQIQEQSAQIQPRVDATIQTYGSSLACALMRGIGGEAARSELDYLSDPLRKMVYKQPRARQWLTDALASDDFPSRVVSDVDKRVWLQKVVNLRGARGTNQAVKDFWMACRGTSLAFAS